MTEPEATPTTEAEMLEAGRLIKRAMAIATFVFTPIMLLFAWYFNVSTIAWIVVGALTLYEIVSFPLLVRMIDRNIAKNVAELREEQGLTPAHQLPDVGV